MDVILVRVVSKTSNLAIKNKNKSKICLIWRSVTLSLHVTWPNLGMSDIPVTHDLMNYSKLYSMLTQISLILTPLRSSAKFCPDTLGNHQAIAIWQNQLAKWQGSANNTSPSFFSPTAPLPVLLPGSPSQFHFSLPLFCVGLHCGFVSFVFIYTLHVNEVCAVCGSAVEVLTDRLWSPLPASLLSVVAPLLLHCCENRFFAMESRVEKVFDDNWSTLAGKPSIFSVVYESWHWFLLPTGLHCFWVLSRVRSTVRGIALVVTMATYHLTV